MIKQFFDHFQTAADTNVRQLWKYHEYETKFGNREEMQFIGSAAILIEMPDHRFEFLCLQTLEPRIYKHASYMLSMFADHVMSNEGMETFEVRLHGNGFQAFVGVNNVKVEALNAEGTVVRQTMFGEPREHVVVRIDGVRLSIKDKK